MKKALKPDEVHHFEEILNIGREMARDLISIGIIDPQDLKHQNAYELYLKLCRQTKTYQDPCILDVFLSAVYFMKGKGTKMWWEFTIERKKNFHIVAKEIARFRY